MAIVYQVTDTITQKSLALKKLVRHRKEERQKHIVELFEQEYLTLTQLAHPRVVEVFDFGFHGQDPYYTMELLDGGDLRELAPVPWQKACVLLCDICSVLSLLHSRRLVHRDLTPRNVLCTADSKAKLIDFGAMVPMGPCKQVVGTPAFTAPEVAALQSLDARADLYSVGATLYYALTGRSPYAARTFAELRSAWRRKPLPPSSVVQLIPKELDELVMTLIDLDPLVRPINAAEVIERLSAIASIQVDEHLLVSQAYLQKPSLVGRQELIAKIRKRVVRSLRGLGSAVVIGGTAGTGKTRVLDACALEGKLAGAVVLRADANDAQGGDWSVVRTLATRLLHEIPDIAFKVAEPFIPILGHVIPELLERAESAGGDGAESVELVAFDNPQEFRPQVHERLRDWLIDVCRQRCLLIAVDDIHRIDEPSAAFVALLANQISEKMVTLVATMDVDVAPTSALKLLQSSASSMKIRNLNREDTNKLLTSVFGEVPRVALLSDRLYKVTQGNPGAMMEFAQHLVDKGVIQYQAGAWTLPQDIHVKDFPQSLSDALKVKIERLNRAALDLACSLALSPEQSFSVDECMRLISVKDKAELANILSELQSVGLVSTDGHFYGLNQPSWISPLLETTDEKRKSALHLSLAELFIKRGNQACRATQHLFEAGQHERGLDVLLADLRQRKPMIETNAQAYFEFIMSLPKEWLAIFERALTICEANGRPAKQKYLIQVLMSRVGDQKGLIDTKPVTQAVERMVDDSGLRIFHELGDSVEPDKRLWRALELAQQRYDTCPEEQRVLSPSEAIFDLAKTTGNVIGMSAASYDYDFLSKMPSLEPLAPLSPALGIIANSSRSMLASMTGHLERAKEGLQRSLVRLSQPDRAGLEETIYKVTDLGHRWGIGILEASFGNKAALQWADSIEHHPLHQVNAWRIRLVYYLRQGDIQEADECKKKMEMLHIQNSPAQFYEGAYQYAELAVYMITDDLMRVKRVIPGIQAMARRYPPWLPICHLAQGEYQRIRGDYNSALAEYEKGLAIAQPGRHIAWPRVIGAKLKALYEMERLEEARDFGEPNLRIAEKVGFEFSADTIRTILALVQAGLGDFDSAIANCRVTVDTYQRLGITGISLGYAYETRARVAICMKDEKSFETYANLCAEQYNAGNYQALVAKYERLMQKARQMRIEITEELARSIGEFGVKPHEDFVSIVSTLLTDCHGREERAERALELLVNQSKTSGGYLYIMQKNGPVLSAQLGSVGPMQEMDSVVRDYLHSEIEGAFDKTMTVADMKGSTRSHFEWTSQGDFQYQPVLLGHDTDRGYVITGLAILCGNLDQDINIPIKAVAALSKSLLDAGDAATVFSE